MTEHVYVVCANRARHRRRCVVCANCGRHFMEQPRRHEPTVPCRPK